jgi:hypothetical protein
VLGGALLWPGCASGPQQDTTVLERQEAEQRPERTAAELAIAGPRTISFQPPPEGGAAYRLILEYGGAEETAEVAAGRPPQQIESSNLLELEYRELPVPGRRDVFQVALDGLHYRFEQKDPPAHREVELWDDRIRTLADNETVMDLQGAQPSGDLTPRKVIGQLFGSVRVNAWGSVQAMRPLGVPVARRFLKQLPLLRGLLYTHPALPPQAVATGARWSAPTLPVGPTGDLGLRLPVEYQLAGFQRLQGVPCAWIVFRSHIDGERVPSAAGFRFDRVLATLEGEAWVELETARIRLLEAHDEIRASYTRGRAPAPVTEHRLRHRTRARLERRDREAKPREWADGRERFGPR